MEEPVRHKDQFLIPFIEVINDPKFKTGTLENDQKLLRSIIVFACLMEGLFFYVGFTQILALGRQNKMTGTAEQIPASLPGKPPRSSTSSAKRQKSGSAGMMCKTAPTVRTSCTQP